LHFRSLTYARLRTVKTIVLYLLLISIIFFTSLPVPHADAGTISLDFKKQGISATIEDASMKAVIEKIAKKKDIWIKGAEKLSGEMYSVEFDGVSVREAFKRMLSSFNRCLFIDRKGALLGVIIVSKKKRRSMPRNRRVVRRIYRGAQKR
jgi:hypothetical protein